MTRTVCMLCGAADLQPVIDLGLHPLADTFLSPALLEETEARYPLRCLLCADCGHVMLETIVPPEERYQKVEYSYTSANSPVAIAHFQEMARRVIAEADIGPDDLVVDVGSSDGTLLAAFQAQAGCRVLGVEPAANIAQLANENGIETLNGFFDTAAAEEIKRRGGAKAITANNVFNHITDLEQFMRDIKIALAPDGIFVFEAPSLIQLVERTAFDTIYLEHLSYFRVQALDRFFRRLGFVLRSGELNDYMGGSLFAIIAQNGASSADVAELMRKEEVLALGHVATYARFMARVRAFKEDLRAEISRIKAEGGVVIGVGAATKGNTLLNYCEINRGMLECVTDQSPLKIGKHTPGSRLPIIPDADIPAHATHALILPWNIGDFLKEKLKHLNLQFIIPRMRKDL